MLLDALRENPSFVALEAEKQEKDKLEATYESVAQKVHTDGKKLYLKLEDLILKEIEQMREQYLKKDNEGVKLALELCHHGVHPWVKRTKYTVRYLSRGDRYYNKSHKRIPKYYIEHCPICGEILCTQKRIYRMGKREIVDIPLEEFEAKAQEFGYTPGVLDRYTEALPLFCSSGYHRNMISVLEELKTCQPPEVAEILQSLLDYFSGNDEKNRLKSEEYQHALDNATELCKIFGHDVRNLDSRCRCCGKRFSKEKLLEDYKNAVMSGVVDFPYLHQDQILLLPGEPDEEEANIFLRI